MLWNLPQPGDTGVLEWRVGVEATGDGAVDAGLFLLVEQRDRLPLQADRTLQAPVRPVEEAHNGGLLGEGGEGDSNALNGAV